MYNNMIMNEKLKEAANKGEEIAREYNPDTNVPFPFGEIVRRNEDLELLFNDLNNLDIPNTNDNDDLSGLILYAEQQEKFVIIIDKNKPENRRNFTIAHELGHYFLHKNILKEKNLVVDGDSILYRLDNGLSNIQESQANYFAASLLMPKERVQKAWDSFDKNIEKCAKLFSVSLAAMSVRVDILGLD